MINVNIVDIAVVWFRFASVNDGSELATDINNDGQPDNGISQTHS